MNAKPITRKLAARRMRALAKRADQLIVDILALRLDMREAGMCDVWRGILEDAAYKACRAAGLDCLALEVERYESRDDEMLDTKCRVWVEAWHDGRRGAALRSLKFMAEGGNRHAARHIAELEKLEAEERTAS